jgi:hypothetical protein
LDPEVTVWNLLEFEFLEVEGVIADLVVTLKNHNFRQIPVLPSNYYGRDGTNSTLQSGRLLDVVHKVSHVLVDGVAQTLLEGDQVFILAVFLGVDLGDVLKLSRLFRDLSCQRCEPGCCCPGALWRRDYPLRPFARRCHSLS